MSDPKGALDGATFQGLIHIEALRPMGMLTLRGDLNDKNIAGALSDVAGVAMPEQRGAVVDGTQGLLWMSPDEAMLLCEYQASADTCAALSSRLENGHALVVDMSDARAVFRLTGPAIREVLAKLTPADMRATALTAGEVRRTRLAQVAAAFWLEDEETAYLICFRSVATYVFDLLRTAAHDSAAVEFF